MGLNRNKSRTTWQTLQFLATGLLSLSIQQWGATNERPGTVHVMPGPMRGLKKTASYGADKQTQRQTDGHGNSMTESAQWGRFS